MKINAPLSFPSRKEAVDIERSLQLSEGLNPITSSSDPEHTLNIRAANGKIVGYEWTDSSGKPVPSFTVKVESERLSAVAEDSPFGYQCFHCHIHPDGQLHCWPIMCP